MIGFFDLMDALEKNPILEHDQLAALKDELKVTSYDVASLIAELKKSAWLTDWQAGMILDSRAHELVLHNYVMLDQIGEGGMGRVYRARHRFGGALRAVKVILPQNVANQQAVQRFHREIQLVFQLQHPNIVLAHDAGEVRDLLYLAMEFVEGDDLANVLMEKKILPVDRAADYVRQAALGLQHAHKHGMVHRDIKPSNLLLTKKDEIVKILDLGLARLREGESAPLTRPDAVMGTPDFMSPEQAKDASHVDIRGDIYSLGCTLYQLLTGSVPYPGGNHTNKILRHIDEAETPEPVTKFRHDVPFEMTTVLERMMAKRPSDRYAEPEEAARALEPFCLPATIKTPDLSGEPTRELTENEPGPVPGSGTLFTSEEVREFQLAPESVASDATTVRPEAPSNAPPQPAVQELDATPKRQPAEVTPPHPHGVDPTKVGKVAAHREPTHVPRRQPPPTEQSERLTVGPDGRTRDARPSEVESPTSQYPVIEDDTETKARPWKAIAIVGGLLLATAAVMIVVSNWGSPSKPSENGTGSSPPVVSVAGAKPTPPDELIKRREFECVVKKARKDDESTKNWCGELKATYSSGGKKAVFDFVVVPGFEYHRDPFYVLKTEVSVHQFRLIAATPEYDNHFKVHCKPFEQEGLTAKPVPFREWNKDKDVDGRLPIRRVTVLEAHCFALALSDLLKLKKWRIRLPSAIQWDKAAGKLDNDPRYPVGPFNPDWIPPKSEDKFREDHPKEDYDAYLKDWYKGKIAICQGNPSPVGESKMDESPYGCMDMAGNLEEWTRTTHSPDGEVDLDNPNPGTEVTVRSKWFSKTAPWDFNDDKTARTTRPAGYFSTAPGIGFRVVLELASK